jgi:hypothetical protein
MVPRMFLALALATALGGVPSFAAAATEAIDGEPPSNAAVMALAVGAAAVALAGLVLLVARRRGSASDMADRERSTEATDQVVSAALTRRTLSRGRLRLDDDVIAGSPRAASPEATERASRISG